MIADGQKLFYNSPWEDKRSRDRPPSHWTDDIKRESSIQYDELDGSCPKFGKIGGN